MKIKVSEATGPVLNWLVAKCEGLDVVIETTGEQAERFKSAISHDGSAPPNEDIDAVIIALSPILRVRGEYGIHLVRVPSYSSDWTQGGPLLDREKISIGFHVSNGVYARTTAYPPEYHYGPTALTAAMRCYVASKLGDYADVPEALARA